MPIQEVSRTYFVSRYFIGRKDFWNFFSLFFAMYGQSISYREAYYAGVLNKNKRIQVSTKLLLFWQNFQRTSTRSTRQIKSRTLLMTIFFLLFFWEKGWGVGRIDDVVRYILVCCWRFKQKSEAGCFLVCCWILFYVQYTWCTITHIHSFFQVNNIIRTFHEYRNKVWSLILSVAERNIIKILVWTIHT